MPRVLLVCYYFPPLGLAGVSRPLNLFRHLPTYGYDCHVLTVKPVAYRKYSPELLHGLDITKIFRSGSRDPQRLMYLLGIREVNPKTIARGSKFGETLFPDSKIGWVNAAVRLGKKLHATYRYDAVISTSPPISAHLVGMRLAHESGLKWIADFRDPWTVVPLEEAYSSDTMKLMGQTLKKQISESASAMTAVNQAVASYVGTTNVINNGFDPEVAKGWEVPKDREKFSIGLLGSYSDEMPLEPLFRVVRKAIESGRIEATHVEFIQVGDTDTTWLSSIAAKYGLGEQVTMHGLRPREETVRLLSPCAMMYAALSRRLEVATTSRIFDMLASGRPILAYASKDGQLARQLADADRCVFEDANENDAIQFLISRVNSYLAGNLTIAPMPDYSLQHAWPRKAEQFAELLRRI